MNGTGSLEPGPPDAQRPPSARLLRRRILIATIAFVVVNGLGLFSVVAAGTRSPSGGCGGGFSGSSGSGCVADLALSNTDSPDPAKVGRNLFYLIEVLNKGPGDAFDVEISDRLPAGMAIRWVMVPASSDPYGGRAFCEVQGQAVFCSFYNVPRFHRAAVTIVVRPISAGTFRNVATVSTRSADPNPSNNSAAQQTTVTS